MSDGFACEIVIRKPAGNMRRMIAELSLERFEKRTEWPLAIAAVIFLAAYSVEVLAQPMVTFGLRWIGSSTSPMHFFSSITSRACVLPLTARAGLCITWWSWRSLPFHCCGRCDC